MYNHAVLMGRICNDLDLKTTPNGVSVLSFRIAVDRAYQADKSNRVSDFFNIVAWRQTADFISRYFAKGRMILVDGELQTRQYTDKNGSTQNVVELVVDNAHFTGEAKAGGSSYQNNSNTENYTQHPAQQTNSAPAMSSGSASDFVESSDSDDDYPF